MPPTPPPNVYKSNVSPPNARLPDVPWTAARDAQLRRLRAEGASWDDIARVLGQARNAVMARARALGARPPPPDFTPPPDDPDREALPAGHPRSWGALLAGSLLDGMDYPLPFFFR